MLLQGFWSNCVFLFLSRGDPFATDYEDPFKSELEDDIFGADTSGSEDPFGSNPFDPFGSDPFVTGSGNPFDSDSFASESEIADSIFGSDNLYENPFEEDTSDQFDPFGSETDYPFESDANPFEEETINPSGDPFATGSEIDYPFEHSYDTDENSGKQPS